MKPDLLSSTTPIPTKVKTAAIWARVSTTSQAETSLPSQVTRCKEKLDQAGFTSIRIFSVDFSSLDLYTCPQFQELRKLIQSGDIQAVAVYDRDRLAAQGLQRLLFLTELKDKGVELIICEGAPIIEGPEGQIVELALAIGKERQVLRARQGSKDGLHDRATLRKLPVTYHKLYGYQWDKLDNRLVPNGSYDNVKLIFDLVLAGNGYHRVIKDLQEHAIPSPSGNPEWNKTALTNIIHNPVYAGRYFALRKQAVAPKERKGNTYGNSSVRKIPLTDATYIPEIEILNPPITWEQRGQILEQLEKHQKLASRNAKQDYLLRGRIFCEMHLGKNGEPRRYHGRPKRNTFYYACPVGGCDHPYIDGRELERFITLLVWNETSMRGPNGFHQALLEGQHSQNTGEVIHSEIEKLQKEDVSLIKKLAQLEDKLFDRKLEQEVYNSLRQQYQKRRTYIKARQDELLEQIASFAHEEQALKNLDDMWHRWNKTILSARKPWRDNWTEIPKESVDFFRDIFNALSIKLIIHPDNAEGPGIKEYNFKGGHIKIQVSGEIPFTEVNIKGKEDIALANPEPG